MQFKNLFTRSVRRENSIIVVSGLPRSGTSMMMQILEAGGIKAITDNVRLADNDNTKGYYEHEDVKALARGVYDCLENAEGCSIKVISSLLKHLPSDRHYKLTFMHREISKVLASQTRMLNNQNKTSPTNNDEELHTLFQKHLSSISQWLTKQDNIDVLNLNYVDLLDEPAMHINRLVNFLHIKADKEAMIERINPNMCHHIAPSTIV